jgi:predicted small secreted protein
MLKKIIIVLFAFSFVTAVAGCANTMEGVGEDIEKMGKSLKDAVKSDKE